MAINKDKFVFNMNLAIEEAKMISKSVDTDSYFDKMSLYKLDSLYSLLNEMVNRRLTTISNEEIEKYRNERINSIVNKINRYMLDLEKEDSSDVKSKIESLISVRTKLESESANDIKNRLLSELKLSSVPSSDKDVDILRKLYNGDEAFNEFLKLFTEYRNKERELKSLEIKRELIIEDLIPNSTNYSFTRSDNNSLLTTDGLKKIEEEISFFIQKSTDEEMAEIENFGEVARKAYFSTICFDNNCEPIDSESLGFLKSKLENQSRLYDTASLELDEWELLNNKTFKTSEVILRISELEKEIRETKKKINQVIRDWYKDYYTTNDLYKPLATRVNNKFIYNIGYDYLDDFFTYGQWPSKENISLLSSSRELNRKEAEKEILKIELVLSKHSDILTNYLNDKKLELDGIKTRMNELVPNWNNPLVMEIIENYLHNFKSKKEK